MIVILACAVVVILAPTCSGFALLEDKHKISEFNLAIENSTSLLECKNGKIAGVWEFINFFQSLSQECKGYPKTDDDEKATAEYYTCLMETIGMTENDGTPNLKNVDIVSRRVFSLTILSHLPGLKQDIRLCALDYESNYNQIDKSRETGAEIFFKCFVDALRKSKDEIGDDYDQVCAPHEEDSYFVS